jgi:hypothetical protein
LDLIELGSQALQMLFAGDQDGGELFSVVLDMAGRAVACMTCRINHPFHTTWIMLAYYLGVRAVARVTCHTGSYARNDFFYKKCIRDASHCSVD